MNDVNGGKLQQTMPATNYKQKARRYALREVNSSDYVAFREVAERRLITNASVLDVGCGAGRSTRFLRELGNTVIGVDASPEMIHEAQKIDPSGEYLHVERNTPFPFNDAHFEAIFTSWVLLEIGNPQEICFILEECCRVMTSGGSGVIITNKPEFYNGNWVSCEVGFPENQPPLISGQQVKAWLVPEGVEVTDYFWTDKDYKQFIKAAGFQLIAELRPLGKPDDPIRWKDEAHTAPYVVYIVKKS